MAIQGLSGPVIRYSQVFRPFLSFPFISGSRGVGEGVVNVLYVGIMGVVEFSDNLAVFNAFCFEFSRAGKIFEY